MLMLKRKLTAWPLSHPLLPGTWVVCVPDEALLFSQAPLHTHPYTYALHLKVLELFSLIKCLPFCDMLAFCKTKTPQSTTQIVDSPLCAFGRRKRMKTKKSEKIKIRIKYPQCVYHLFRSTFNLFQPIRQSQLQEI